MSRRSSNTVRLARARRSPHASPLDRNGIPILDDRHSPMANRLPKRCATVHAFVKTGKRFVRGSYDGDVYEIESRCARCGEKITETEVA